MMEWLRDKVILQRLTTTRYLLSRKEQESVAFVKEEFLHLEDTEKRRSFWILDHKFTEEGSVK